MIGVLVVVVVVTFWLWAPALVKLVVSGDPRADWGSFGPYGVPTHIFSYPPADGHIVSRHVLDK